MGGEFLIHRNPMLPTCEATGLLEGLVSFDATVCIKCNLADACPPSCLLPGCN